MADVITVKIDGLHKLGEAMENLKSDLANKISRSAVNKGAQLVKENAVALAPKWPVSHKLDGVIVPSGNLKANIVVKKIKSPLTAEYIVTVRGKRKDFYAARYGRLVEFGVPAHGIAANSFMRKAFDVQKRRAADVIIEELEKGITKQVIQSPSFAQSLKDDLGIE